MPIAINTLTSFIQSGCKKRKMPFTSMHPAFNKWFIALWICAFSYFVVFSLLGVWRHWGYLTSPYDLGAFDQAVWTASQGGSLLNSFNGSGQTMNWLGIHFQPILYLFVPLYNIYPSVHWLTLSQSAALAFSSLPIFAIARHVTHSEKHAFIWAIIFLLNPFVIGAATWDFHEVSLATFFISLGLYAITQKRLVLLIICSIFLLACKEHFGLTVAGLGILYGIAHKNWMVGVGFAVIGIVLMSLIIGVIMPSFSPTGQHPMIRPAISMHPSTGRYSWLGDSLHAVIKNIISHPFVILETVFVTMERWEYLFSLLVPFLLLPVLAPIWAIPIASDLLANLLSSVSMPCLIISYHSATIIPVLTVAAIHGLQRISPYLKTLSVSYCIQIILLLNVALAYHFAPFSFPGSLNYWKPVNTVATFDNREPIIKQLIDNKSASIQANLIPHFTQKKSFYFYPEKIDSADFIVLRLESPTTKLIPSASGEFGTIEQLLQMPPALYLDSVEKLLDNQHFQLVYWSDPWLIFGKEKKYSSPDAVIQVRAKIKTLREEWPPL